MCCTGVILSGGVGKRLSSYFPTKQFLKYKGTPLVVRAINNLPSECSEVIVTVNTQNQLIETQKLLSNYFVNGEPIKIVIDDKELFGEIGPLNGFLSGLKNASNNKLVVKPVDTPNLIPSHYQALLSLIKKEHDTASFIDQSGYISTLNVAIKEREKRLEKLTYLIKQKQKYGIKIRASDIFLTGKNIALLRVIEQAVHVLKNINTPKDLELRDLRIHKIDVFKDEVFNIINEPEYVSLFDYLEAGTLNEDQINSILKPWLGTHIYAQLTKDLKTFFTSYSNVFIQK